MYIDGKLFDRAFYDLSKYTNFGYKNTYVQDGSPLEPGRHHIVVLNPIAPTDTLIREDRILSDERQSLIYIGRYDGTPAERPRAVYLRDQLRSVGTIHTYARFVDGVSDLDTLDTYFSKYAKLSSTSVLAPDLRMGYGTISDKNGTGAGTGLSAEDYLIIPSSSDGLRVTRKADTTAPGTILTIPYWNPSIHLLATIIVRGEIKAICTEPTVAVLALTDGEQGVGNFSFNDNSYGVRFVNASRHDSLSLLADGVYDRATGSIGIARNNIPQQATVLQVPRDTITDYWPLTLTYHGTPDFYTSPTINQTDTVHRLDTAKRGSSLIASANGRYMIIGTETKPLGSSGDDSALVLLDTTCVPLDAAFGRVRFVNASPDHSVQFTFAGKSFSLNRNDVAYWDAPIAAAEQPIPISASSSTFTIGTKWVHDYPATVIFMPATATNPYPYSVVYK